MDFEHNGIMYFVHTYLMDYYHTANYVYFKDGNLVFIDYYNINIEKLLNCLRNYIKKAYESKLLF